LIVSAYAERWAALISGATVEMVPDAAHMLPYEQPQVFVSAVSRFLG
jgi:pimeloyl-ACP methyl ester carboxylesterase